jgi:hypothetical protein
MKVIWVVYICIYMYICGGFYHYICIHVEGHYQYLLGLGLLRHGRQLRPQACPVLSDGCQEGRGALVKYYKYYKYCRDISVGVWVKGRFYRFIGIQVI